MRLDPPLPPTHLGKLRELPLLLLLRMLRLDQIPEARAIDYCLQEGVSLIACKAERRHSHRSQGGSLEGSQRPPLWSRTSTPKGHRFVLVGQVLEVVRRSHLLGVEVVRAVAGVRLVWMDTGKMRGVPGQGLARGDERTGEPINSRMSTSGFLCLMAWRISNWQNCAKIRTAVVS